MSETTTSPCDGRHRASTRCHDPGCYLRQPPTYEAQERVRQRYESSQDPHPATPGEIADAEVLEEWEARREKEQRP